MCGIAGALGVRTDPSTLERMLDTIRHRGPDDSGTFIDGELALGIRRLAVIDIANGRQPMFSHDGRLAIVFNGEIYNHREIRARLEAAGARFDTRCDTEVVLRLFEHEGPRCVQSLRGMFAFAIADARENRVFLARDRLGIKPLYLYRAGRTLVFGSEIKALLEHPRVTREPNLRAVEDYLTLRYVPGPDTLFAGIQKVPPAHWAIWRDGKVEFERYWSLEGLAPAKTPLGDAEYSDRFVELFDESVRLRLASDVPVGTFLSGGLDSGAVASSMAAQGDGPVHSFSIGFDWKGDELEAARETATRIGCVHRELVCQPSDFAQLPRLIWHLDEPIGDAIVMPMFLLSSFAREDVTVVLTGEGADETLAGYFMHKALTVAEGYRRALPGPLRGLARRAAALVPPAVLNAFFDYPGTLGGKGKRRLLTFLDLVESGDLDAEYRFLISLFDATDLDRLWPGRPRGSRKSNEVRRPPARSGANPAVAVSGLASRSHSL